MHIPVEGGDDVRPVEVGGRTGPAAETLDEASDAIEGGREDRDRDDAPEQTVVGLAHAGDPPAADQFPELNEPSRTAVGPTTQ